MARIYTTVALWNVLPETDAVSFPVMVGGSPASPNNVIKGNVLGIITFSLNN